MEKSLYFDFFNKFDKPKIDFSWHQLVPNYYNTVNIRHHFL